MMNDFSIPTIGMQSGTILWRADRCSSRPATIFELEKSSAGNIKDFKRHKDAVKPMIYCSDGIAAALKESQAVAGERVYVSSWLICSQFQACRMPSLQENHSAAPATDMKSIFVGYDFLNSSTDFFTYRHKSATTLSTLFSRSDFSSTNLDSTEIGAVTYSSAVGRGDHMAVNPVVWDECTKLERIIEIKIIEEIDENFICLVYGFSSAFDGGRMTWEGSDWNASSGSFNTFVA